MTTVIKRDLRGNGQVIKVPHHYGPRGAALDLLNRRDPEILLSGPAGTGKSRACLEKVHLACLLTPNVRALATRKTLVSLSATGMVTFREKVAKEGIACGVLKYFGGSPTEQAGYKYANGSFLALGGLDKPEKIMSSEYDLVYVQEATELHEQDWEAILSRLRNGVISFQQLLADCNPGHPSHWLNQRALRGDTVMLQSRHQDNPVYYTADGTLTQAGEDYIVGKLGRLSGVRRLRLLDGLWAAAEGLVYEEFDDKLHVADALPQGSETWPRWWAVDFGFKNPMVVQMWAEDPDGGLWLYRELYQTETLVEDMARLVLKAVRRPLRRDPDPADPRHWEWTEPKPEKIVCDHDAEDRATFEKHLQLPTTAADKRVKAGVQAMQSRFKVEANGRTRIHFVRDAVVRRDHKLVQNALPASTLEEVTGYVWPQGVKPDQRENPVKENDHGCDAARYLVAHRDLASQSRYRSFNL